MNFNLTPFPILITDRLLLKQLELNDDTAIFALRSSDEVNKFVYRKKAETLKDAQDFIAKINKSVANNDSIYWGIKLKNSDALIGTICLWNIEKDTLTAEIGYELLPDFQGKGIMQEAVSSVIKYSFKLGFTTITAFPHADNVPSIKLLERNHFKKTGAVIEENGLIYALTK
jgi:[ribosomal protein S5]-alanine N-acetyltransferase